jgi:murE/murF fusion protein
MKTLKKLLSDVNVQSCSGKLSGLGRKVSALAADSRKIRAGSVFFALKGNALDGHRYVKKACLRGCVAVVVEEDAEVPDDVISIRVEDTHQAYGLMAAELYDHPGRAMRVIGLTGTNGKTTTSWIIEEMMQADGRRPGVVGTVNYRYPGPGGETVVKDASLTTPEPVFLQQLLRQMADSGVTDVIIEVSSHALDQKRLAGIRFDAAVFTNLSRDHLDYHHTMTDYFTAKTRLFLDYLKQNGVAVVMVGAKRKGKNTLQPDWGRKLLRLLQDENFQQFGRNRKNKTYITCGIDPACTVAGSEPFQDIHGSAFRVNLENKQALDVTSHLIGRHNVLNMLAAVGAGLATGIKVEAIRQGLHRVESIPGRLERVTFPFTRGSGERPHVFVDYAHTPDALENVLRTLRQVTRGRLICVFGCGGNRDRGKRPLMGEVAGQLADAVLVTSDNPRREDPAAILREIEHGLSTIGIKKIGVDELLEKKSTGPVYGVLEDRREAIHQVCSRAGEGDVILVAGKGHETYQITRQGKKFFDDRLEVKNGRIRWNAAHIVAATSGKVAETGQVKLYGNISTDSRTLKPGDVFVALQGENFDGHDHVAEAVSKGAAAVVVSRLPPGGSGGKAAVIEVEDTLTALGDLARYRRKFFGSDVKVIAVTGSSGKTTVKEMAAAIFEAAESDAPGERLLKTRGNLNNLIGLPLSLLRLQAGHRVAVLEMGMNRPGEIKRMTEIAEPDIGCINNVQAAHLEGLGSIEGVARAKGELFDAMPENGIRVINYDDPLTRKSGDRYGNTFIGFAVTPVGRRCQPAVRATRIISLAERGMRFTLHVNTWRKRITIPATGAHNVANSAAAAAIATAAGVDPEVIVRGLLRYRSGDKRLQVTELPGDVNVLNDSYNANPSSMAAALQTISHFGRECRRVAALGDMLELGEASEQAHREVGILVAELGFDFLAVTGNFAGDVAGAALAAGMKRSRVKQCRTAEDAARWIAGLMADRSIRRGDWILLKGSRGMRMEQVLSSLKQRMAT